LTMYLATQRRGERKRDQSRASLSTYIGQGKKGRKKKKRTKKRKGRSLVFKLL